MIVLEVAERNATVNKVSFSSDGRLLRFRSFKKRGFKVQIATGTRNLATGKQTQFLPSGLGTDFCEHPLSGWLFGMGEDDVICGYNPTQNKLVASELIGLFCSHFATTPNGEIILFSSHRTGESPTNGYGSQLWSKEEFGSGFSIVENRSNSRWYQDPTCHGLAPLPDNERFATLNWRWGHLPILSFRSVSSGEIINETTINGFDAPALAVSPHENFVAVTVARSIHILDTEDLSQPPHVIKNDGKKHFTGVAFHPSERLLGVTSNDNTAKFYDTQSWAVKSTFDWDIGKLRSIAFSNDGTLAAAGSDTGKVVIWDVDL